MRAGKPTTWTTTPRRFHLAVVRELHTGLGSAESAGASVNYTREPAWIQFEPDGHAVVAVAGGCPVARWDVRGNTEDVAALAGGGDAALESSSVLVVSMREERASEAPKTFVARALVLGFHSARDARDARAALTLARKRKAPNENENERERERECAETPRRPSRANDARAANDTANDTTERNELVGGSDPPRLINWGPSPAAEDDSNDAFTAKIDRASAEAYFSYYARISEQQNMLQDRVRVGTYFTAIMEHRAAFEGAVVMDVGAGSGVLSCFAALAGARRVYAVEASDMADHCARLVARDARTRDVIVVIKGRVESDFVRERVARDFFELESRRRGSEDDSEDGDADANAKVIDVLISEPMGTMLFNERMIESFLIARDVFLKPRVGQMFPRAARLHCAPYEDHALFAEIADRAAFWNATNAKDFYGIDVSVLGDAATCAVFAQPCVDAFDPAILLADPATFEFDFLATSADGERRTRVEDLASLTLRAEFAARRGGVVHGVAWWFDVEFDARPNEDGSGPGSNRPGPHRRFLTTAPGAPTTHWFQMRLPLRDSLPRVKRGGRLSVETEMAAGSDQSYAVTAKVSIGSSEKSSPSRVFVSGAWNLKDPYYRQLLWPQPGYTEAQTKRWYGDEAAEVRGADVGFFSRPDES